MTTSAINPTDLPADDVGVEQENGEKVPAEAAKEVRKEDQDAPGNWLVDPTSPPVEPNEPG
jgi:hypothetical protein